MEKEEEVDDQSLDKIKKRKIIDVPEIRIQTKEIQIEKSCLKEKLGGDFFKWEDPRLANYSIPTEGDLPNILWMENMRVCFETYFYFIFYKKFLPQERWAEANYLINCAKVSDEKTSLQLLLAFDNLVQCVYGKLEGCLNEVVDIRAKHGEVNNNLDSISQNIKANISHSHIAPASSLNTLMEFLNADDSTYIGNDLAISTIGTNNTSCRTSGRRSSGKRKYTRRLSGATFED
jgi:hypothetical protein